LPQKPVFSEKTGFSIFTVILQGIHSALSSGWDNGRSKMQEVITMSKQSILIIASALLALLALGVTACRIAPGAVSVLQPSVTATAVPTLMPTVAATPEAQSNPPMPDRKRAEQVLKIAGLSGGIVTANRNGTLMLRTSNGAEQIQTGPNTIVVIPGQNNAQVADIRVRDRVIVDFGGTDTAVAAALLLDFPADYDANNVLVGAVRASRRDALTVRTPAGVETLTPTGTTLMVDMSQDKPALGVLGDLEPGNAVLVIGVRNGESFEPQVIVILEKDARDLLNRGSRSQPMPMPTPKP
jgi:hypothetical protein